MSSPHDSHDVIDRDAWITLAAVTGVGEARFATLLEEHGTPQQVLRAAADGRIRPTPARPREVVRLIAAAARDPGSVHRLSRELGLWMLTPLDPTFPPRLARLDPPPAVIYGQGDPVALDAARAVAIVGTRRPTLVGRALAARVAARLVECHAVVISGLAVGIDGAGHSATLDAGGRTVAVIGGGHARLGPRAHRPLARRIVELGGAVVAELPPDARPTKGTFPRRNRVISALADAILVIEAPLRSGALITARLALEAGQSVLVAPGRPGDPSTAGCLALLRDSPARPLIGLDELVADLGFAIADQAPTPRSALDRQTALSLLGEAEGAVARALGAGPASTDVLAMRTGLGASVVAGAVTLLQLRGWVQSFGPNLLPAGPLLATGAQPSADVPPSTVGGRGRTVGVDRASPTPARARAHGPG